MGKAGVIEDGDPRWTLYRSAAGVVIEDDLTGGFQLYGPLPTMEQALAVAEALIKEHTRALIDAMPVLQQVDLSGAGVTLNGPYGTRVES